MMAWRRAKPSSGVGAFLPRGRTSRHRLAISLLVAYGDRVAKWFIAGEHGAPTPVVSNGFNAPTYEAGLPTAI